MVRKTEIGEQPKSGPLQNVETPRENDSGLEKVLSFWGSYCFADVSSWTSDEVDGFADLLEEKQGPIRRQRSIIQTKSDDGDKRSNRS